ncbi:tetratricopeptide repeat protein [Salinimonas chungwhensis]|uniref:hypothetical protein n=1 Tax=Salinimonas chungwhensis TaxID=265425 RepID=UPI000376439C|nr:hypothetical protein [Salinimonas chungwhensis]
MKLHRCKIISSSILAATALVAPLSMAATSEPALQLKTSVEDVNGVREIESGNFADGIRKTLAALEVTTVDSRRAPLLNNLCVAQVASGNISAAEKACESAVETASNKAIALNNRAILNCLNGATSACQKDLKQASIIANHNRLITNNFNLVNQKNLLVKR